MDGSQASGSPPAEMLTPRSKVAKMLADIDDAPTPFPPTRASNAQQGATGLRKGSPKPAVQQREVSSAANDDSSDEDDAPVQRPQGRVARRMLGKAASCSSPAPPSGSKLPRSSPPVQRDSQMLSAAADDDGDELYSATPNRPPPQQQGMRLLSGSPLGSERGGGLFVSPAKTADHERDNEDIEDEDELPENPFGSKEKLAALVAKKRDDRLAREAEEASKRAQQQKAHRGGSKKTQRSDGRKRRLHQQAKHNSSDLPDEVLHTSQDVPDPQDDAERLMSDAARPTRKASKKALLEMERETQRMSRQQALAHQMKVKKKFNAADLMARFARPQQNQGVAQAKEADGQAQDQSRQVDDQEPSGSSSVPNSDGAEMPAGQEPVSTPPSSPPTAGPTPLDKQKAIVERGALSKLMPAKEDSLNSLAEMGTDDELPDLGDVLTQARNDKQKQAESHATVAAVQEPPEEERRDRRGFKLARLGKKATVRQYEEPSDDDELDIIAPLPKHLQMFDKVKPVTSNAGADSRAIHTLKHLSHIGAYENVPRKQRPGQPVKVSVGPKALELQLRKRAKDQARQQQAERIAELKAKGVEIQTKEEKEREAEMFENLLEKARQQAVDLRKAEKQAAKQAGDFDAAVDVSDDEEEDGDYFGSGSEGEEEEERDEEEDEEDEEQEGEGLVDEAAMEEEGEEKDAGGEELAEDEGDDAEPPPGDGSMDASQRHEFATPAPKSRKSRQSRIVQDDEDEDEDRDLNEAHTQEPDPSQNEDPFAAFDFGPNAGAEALMSPTQAFQATMQTPSQATQDDSFDMLNRIAPASRSSEFLPPTVPTQSPLAFPAPSAHEESQVDVESQGTSVVPGSQVPESQRMELGWETQAPETPAPVGIRRDASNLSETPGWEPTQDAGLPSPWTMAPRREVQDATGDGDDEHHETQETVRLRISESPAPTNTTRPARRGRLMRRQAVDTESDSSADEATVSKPAASKAESREGKDAFGEMKRRRAMAMTDAERKDAEKEMRGMLEEQAEESEDEYAGLGGDDFVAPETEEDKEMIDSSHVDVDENAIAAHFAEKQRAADEAETNKLLKDITTGALRRRTGGNLFGLEEDEDELAMRRRAARQREETRKRKLLLKDDNIANLAQGKNSKGKDAFLKAIADDDERDDDMLDLSDEENSQQPATQEESQESSQQELRQDAQTKGPLAEVSGNKRRLNDADSGSQERPPAKQRRTQTSAFRKPTSMLEVRESLSFLLEEPETGLAAPTVNLDSGSEKDDEEDEYGSDPEDGLQPDDEEDLEAAERSRENDGQGLVAREQERHAKDAMAMPPPPPPRLPGPQRRTPAAAPTKSSVVDRLSLKRALSSSDPSLAGGPTAWAAPSVPSARVKAPSLLRRATTNMSTAGAANDRGVTVGHESLGRSDRNGSGSGVRMGGSKKSSLAYQARVEERKAIVEASSKRREENTKKIAEMRRNSSALSRGLTGRFE
ncbi:hypothetical protein D0869_05818 [Hortaea werneckii]|uniref:DNA replication checkpoint mediator MRC1 domain-containing protein n=1 Tax=Hortaea werneckii TaxID=91943 RepID=A0A3M6WVX7_HORWE|nr:hypothetical protein D0869_05818 [Hortaea werneckii]RMY02444.1 hypothetical protein D0868_07961 [Hortaea werneckii]